MAGVVALVMVAVLAGFGWAYFTGRLGFGPLSAADKEAAEEIAGGVEAPEWASDSDVTCAAEDLVSEERSGGLIEAGIITEGDRSYTGDWSAGSARDFTERLLECVDDWPAAVGETWALDDTECLSGISAGTISGLLAVDLLALEGDDATSGQEDAVAELDECYAEDPSAPTSDGKPAYRAVKFSFDEVDVPNAEEEITVLDQGDSTILEKSNYRARAAEGDEEVCITVKVDANYGWGTTRSAEEQSCGVSAPKKLFWEELSQCEVDDAPAPCRSWELHFEGYATGEVISAVLSENGGDCNSESGNCTFDELVPATGRGVVVTWSALANWTERFTGTVEELTAVLQN